MFFSLFGLSAICWLLTLIIAAFPFAQIKFGLKKREQSAISLQFSTLACQPRLFRLTDLTVYRQRHVEVRPQKANGRRSERHPGGTDMPGVSVCEQLGQTVR
jgi:hypothetical protein